MTFASVEIPPFPISRISLSFSEQMEATGTFFYCEQLSPFVIKTIISNAHTNVIIF